jgi:general secretion pathway protein G
MISGMPIAPTSHPRGFTLVELMLVVAIGTMLVMVAIPMYEGYVMRSKMARAVGEMTRIDAAIENYRISHDELPDSLSTVFSPVPQDPWDRDFVYLRLDPPTHGSRGAARKDHNLVPINSDYDLYSQGEDGRSVGPLTAAHSRDDLVRANNGAYIGAAADY